MAVSKRLRYEVLRRDNHACRYCGATAPDVKLNVDHVIPQSLGGTDTPSNLVASCADCNAGKTSSMPNAMVIADVDQETFRRAATHQSEAMKLRKAVAAHLFATWIWAWERAATPGPDDADKQDFAEELEELLDRGLAAQLDLTEVVFDAGSDRAIDPATYLPNEYLTAEERAHRAPLSDDEFARAGGAYGAWWAGWEQSSPKHPRERADRSFYRELRRAIAAGHEHDEITRAAYAAGLDLRSDLASYLPKSQTVAGDR